MNKSANKKEVDDVDQRKVDILNAIVRSYILSPVPVGSRKISKEFDLGVSSATVRNEMSDLEELGYLNKPHSSAGRIPSDTAYRFYVDEFLDKIFSEEVEYNNTIHIVDDQIIGTEEFYKTITDHLAEKTNSIAYLLAPKKRDTGIRYLDLIQLDSNLILVVLVGNLGIVERSVLRTRETMEEEDIQYISRILSESLCGVNFSSIGALKLKLTGEMIKYEDLILKVVQIASQVASKVNEIDIYASGISNLLNYEEFQDISRIRDIMTYIGEKENLKRLIQELPMDEELTIRIGTENADEFMHDNSLISATYHMGESTAGRVGIIGPVRMDYLRIIKMIRAFTDQLSEKMGEY